MISFDKPLRLGVVGLGFGRYGFIPAARELEDIVVTALCGRRETPTVAWAKQLGVPHVFTDADTMVDSGLVDAVIVATPPVAQVAIAERLLSRRIPVLLTKPLAPTDDAARRLAALAGRNETTAMMDFLFPEIPTWVRCRELIEGGAIGDPCRILITWCMESYDHRHGLQTWKTSRSEGGGVLCHFGSHALYNLEWMLGRITELRGMMETGADLAIRGDTLTSIDFRLNSGAVGVVVLSSAMRRFFEHRWVVCGSRGSLVLRNDTSDPVRGFKLHLMTAAGEFDESLLDPPLAPSTDSRVPLLTKIVRRFVDDVRLGSRSDPTLEQGARVQELISGVVAASGQAWQTPVEAPRVAVRG